MTTFRGETAHTPNVWTPKRHSGGANVVSGSYVGAKQRLKPHDVSQALLRPTGTWTRRIWNGYVGCGGRMCRIGMPKHHSGVVCSRAKQRLRLCMIPPDVLAALLRPYGNVDTPYANAHPSHGNVDTLYADAHPSYVNVDTLYADAHPSHGNVIPHIYSNPTQGVERSRAFRRPYPAKASTPRNNPDRTAIAIQFGVEPCV